MILRSRIFFGTLPADQIKLKDVLDKLTKENIERFPVLNDIIHRSALDKYLVEKASQAFPPKLEELTPKNLLDDSAKLKRLLETSFATMQEDAILADAKSDMDRTFKCQDVFVTANGTNDEPVKGWITNVIINQNATV